MHGVPDLASAGRHQATDRTNERINWEKVVNKIVTECWVTRESTKRKYKQRMKTIWDEMGVFPVTDQRLANQARHARTNKWLTYIEMEEIRRQWEKNNSTAKVQGDDQEIIEHKENKQRQLEEQGTQ